MENKKQKTDNRNPKTENRNLKTENRKWNLSGDSRRQTWIRCRAEMPAAANRYEQQQQQQTESQ